MLTFPRVPMGLAFLCLSLSAQSADQLQSFKEEYVIQVDEQAASLLNEDLADALMSGSAELRQQVQFDAPARELTLWTFSVLPGASPVTPMLDLQLALIEKIRVNVGNIALSNGRIVFTGTVDAGSKPLLWNVTLGDTLVLASDLPVVNSNTFRNTVITLAGNNSLYFPAATGSLQFSITPNRKPVIVITPDLETSQSEVRLDAIGSYDPDGDQLDFKWHLAAGAASLRYCETPNPVFQFSSGSGIYQFVLTLTDSRGAASEATVNVRYYGR